LRFVAVFTIVDAKIRLNFALLKGVCLFFIRYSGNLLEALKK